MNEALPKDRLATTDESGKRIFLYPADVRGKFKGLRRWVHAGFILFFLVLPWVHVHGRQLLLLDVAHREFFFFGLHFRSHDAPLLIFLFLAFFFLLGMVSAIWGRLWCGWACPQTVFTEFLFRSLERWIEGAPRARKELDDSVMTFTKFIKKGFKWLVFLLISLIFTHSFLAYFVGSKEMLTMLQSSPTENWPSFLVILVTTAIVVFDFGWFREQFCIIACPYGRFQSVLLDSSSLVVAYNTQRGEPRRGSVPMAVPQGDCVDCLRCVQVCPTGIDIRRGLQMECVACTACIDACDEVMTKTKKPLGLISYTTQNKLSGKKTSRFNQRAAIYALLFFISLSALALTISQKEFLDVTVFRAAGAPYEIMAQADLGIVSNHFWMEFSNQTDRPAEVLISLDTEDSKLGIALIVPMNPVKIADNANQRVDFFVKFPKTALVGGSRIIHIHAISAGNDHSTEVSLVGPG
ncbi:MAG: cytochrome c oxidase accessory protein CcoG, partial [Bdellovibrionota bacterium]